MVPSRPSNRFLTLSRFSLLADSGISGICTEGEGRTTIGICFFFCLRSRSPTLALRSTSHGGGLFVGGFSPSELELEDDEDDEELDEELDDDELEELDEELLSLRFLGGLSFGSFWACFGCFRGSETATSSTELDESLLARCFFNSAMMESSFLSLAGLGRSLCS